MEYEVGNTKIRSTKLKKILARKTHFSEEEIIFLMELFDEITTGKMDRRDYTSFLFEQFDIDDELILDRIFKVTVKSKQRQVDIMEFIMSMSIMLRGKTEERIKCISHDVYNLSKDDFISKFDIMQLLKNSILKSPSNVEADDFLKELIELTIKKLSLKGGQRIYLEDYRQAVLRQPELLQCLGTVFPSPEKVEAFEHCYFKGEKSSCHN